MPALVDLLRSLTVQRVMALPDVVLRRLAGAPVVVDGRRLDPQMQLMLRLQALDGPPMETRSISTIRRLTDAGGRLVGGSQPIGAVTDRTIEGPGGPLTLRFYTPRGSRDTTPALLYLHGGGFTYGSLDSHDAVCRFLAERAQVRVIALDYRLAPESPFPAAVEDVRCAWDWVVEHAAAIGVDADRIAVGGDSAGGNLAASLARQAVREGAAAPAFQLLLYPAADFVERHPSRDLFAEGFFLTEAFIDLTLDAYLVGDEDLSDPRLTLLGHDLSELPPAYVMTAGFDPLRDEGQAYAAQLEAAGVEVEAVCEDGLIHSFVNMVGIGRSAPQAMARAASALQRGLGSC